MQKNKLIKIGDRSFIIKELPTRAIWDLVNGPKNDQTPVVDKVQSLLALSCPELTQDTLLDLYPSEIEELWATFQEVNAAFLGVVRRTGMFEIMVQTVGPLVKSEMVKAMQKIEPSLTGQSASSSSPDTGPSSGTTAMVSSEQH